MTNAPLLRSTLIAALRSIDDLVLCFGNDPANILEYKDQFAGDWFKTVRDLKTGQGILRAESVLRSGRTNSLYSVGFRFVFKAAGDPFAVFDAFSSGLPSLTGMAPDTPLPFQNLPNPISGYDPMSWPTMNPASLSEPAYDFWEILFVYQRTGSGR